MYSGYGVGENPYEDLCSSAVDAEALRRAKKMKARKMVRSPHWLRVRDMPRALRQRGYGVGCSYSRDLRVGESEIPDTLPEGFKP